MSEFTLRQLRTLASVHRNGRIISASKELGLTQPAVSLQIKEAENIAGTPSSIVRPRVCVPLPQAEQ